MTGFRTALMAAAALLSTAAYADDTASVQTQHLRAVVDQSTVLRLDRPAKTVIVGNPAIADVQLIDGRTIYVLGRMFGTTNIVALDADSAEVINANVTVGVSQSQQVTLYRGPNGRRTLACAPQCERTIMPGDSEMQAISQDSSTKIDGSQKSATLSTQR